MIIIGGATASGKSTLAINVAKHLNSGIISADSMQIYKHMDIGTAKTNEYELSGTRQFLTDIVDPSQNFSVFDYQSEFETTFKLFQQSNTPPVIVGGTGLYINSIAYPLGFGGGVEIKKEILDEIDSKLLKFGREYVWNWLNQLDSVSALKIHFNNEKRVKRALSVTLASGIPFSGQVNKSNINMRENLMYCIDWERDALYSKIDKRVDMMIASGLISEIESLLKDFNLTFEMQSMQGIGYKEWRGFFDGKIDLTTTSNMIKQHSRNYAKRQLTWFKNQYNHCKWLPSNLGESEMVEIVVNDFTGSTH